MMPVGAGRIAAKGQPILPPRPTAGRSARAGDADHGRLDVMGVQQRVDPVPLAAAEPLRPLLAEELEIVIPGEAIVLDPAAREGVLDLLQALLPCHFLSTSASVRTKSFTARWACRTFHRWR